jgi:hypothetical protein
LTLKEIDEKGLAEYKREVKKNPNDANSYFNMSKAFDGLNEGRKAILAARKAQQIWEFKKDSENSIKVRKRLRELYKNYQISPQEFDDAK